MQILSTRPFGILRQAAVDNGTADSGPAGCAAEAAARRTAVRWAVADSGREGDGTSCERPPVGSAAEGGSAVGCGQINAAGAVSLERKLRFQVAGPPAFWFG
ncbi:hypothetical protein ON010_g10495 [Phytophthora cinnamomi]|nr:hypothetical protein ON010_g10495 [Phytophthora cinnamomi]